MSTGHVTGRKGFLCTARGSADTCILTLNSPAGLIIAGRTSSWLPGTDGLHLPRSELEKSHTVSQQKFLQSIKSLLLNNTLIYFPLFVQWEKSFGILQFYFFPVLSVREKKSFAHDSFLSEKLCTCHHVKESTQCQAVKYPALPMCFYCLVT